MVLESLGRYTIILNLIKIKSNRLMLKMILVKVKKKKQFNKLSMDSEWSTIQEIWKVKNEYIWTKESEEIWCIKALYDYETYVIEKLEIVWRKKSISFARPRINES